MLFSIIIPVFNVQDYLKQCIDSVVPQAKKVSSGCEIILVDDGSTDNSGAICDEYAKNYSDCVQVIHKENQGLLFARRSGLEIACGEYILNLDSDDMLAQNALRDIENVLSENDADIIFFNIDLLKGQEKTPYFENVFTADKICKIKNS